MQQTRSWLLSFCIVFTVALCSVFGVVVFFFHVHLYRPESTLGTQCFKLQEKKLIVFLVHFIVSIRNANILGALFFFCCCCCSQCDCGRYGEEKTAENKAKKSYNERIKEPNDKTEPSHRRWNKITKQSPVGCVLNAECFCYSFFPLSLAFFPLYLSLSCRFQWERPYGFWFVRSLARLSHSRRVMI